MKKDVAGFAALILLGFAVSLNQAHAGEQTYSATSTSTSVEEETALDIIRLDSSYVFASELDNDFGPSTDQDVLQNIFEYSHRFRLAGRIYLRTGVGYERFDFGETAAPVPEHLHSISAFVGLEYMVGNDIGAFLYLRPGFYTEDDIGMSSFDMPVTLGRVFVLQPDRLYVLVGATGAGLRGEFPVLPIAGLIWKPTDRWNFFLVPPEPRISYSISDKLDVFVNGQLVGGAFRTDRDDDIQPSRLSNAQVDYTEYRAGLGMEIRCSSAVAISLNGGYAFQRRFNFERAGYEFESDGAPFVRAALKAEF